MNKQTLKQVGGMIKSEITNESTQEGEKSTKMSDTIIEAANKPPIKTDRSPSNTGKLQFRRPENRRVTKEA